MKYISTRSIQVEFIDIDLWSGQNPDTIRQVPITSMNGLKTPLIAALAIVATAIVPISTASAAGHYDKPFTGNHAVHKGGPGYHAKHGPRGAYPRDYHRKRPPVVVQKGKGNALAAGLAGFAAGAFVGNALSRYS